MTAAIAEYRNFDWFDPECRAESEGDTITISGYGAVFNKSYQVFDFQERIAPGAFDKTLRENPDIRGMFNHDPNYLLGRTASGTMDVTTDKRGMRYTIRADATDPNSVSVAKKVARGDVDGSSMMFFVHQEEWKTDKDGKPTERTIKEVQLVETGPVVLPASPTTTAKVKRAMEQTGLDIEALEGIFIKFRAGFSPEGEHAELVKRSIATLTQLLASEPELTSEQDHSESTPAEPPVEGLPADWSRVLSWSSLATQFIRQERV